MLERIIDTCIRNRFITVLVTGLAIAAGVYAMKNTPLDAIPDLSDVQVIVLTEYPGQAPQLVEDQVTYPLTTAMMAVPLAKSVRGYSFFGLSFVYVIFEDETDMYWARSRVLEYLNFVSDRRSGLQSGCLIPSDPFTERSSVASANHVPYLYQATNESDFPPPIAKRFATAR